jgi:catechol 2,3-dioxygenase-like lactoylglutathione lyase family enzyme
MIAATRARSWWQHGVVRNIDRTTEWDQLRERYLKPPDQRPPTTARGVHHEALLCADVETTIQFYDGLLGFPLIDLFENRDAVGSTHFFFDIGNGNTLAFFDFPTLDLDGYSEVLGGHHHLAISMSRANWEAARDRLATADVDHAIVSESSMYFSGPDGERLELISDPLGEMYGSTLL